MMLMRRFEEKAGQLYGMQKIRGFCHLYIGQEACAAGSVSALRRGDKYITAYRDHAHPLALGTHPNKVMAELYGKETGASKGKGGSMHIFDKENHFFGGHGIVGAQVPLGAGIAFAEMYNNTGNLCICYMGDGAVRQGALHEAFNMAMLWKLPVVFVVENNAYAMGTSVERTSNVTELYKLGLPHDYYNFENSVNFLNDIISCCQILNIKIFLKRKRKPNNRFHDKAYTRFCDELVSNHKIIEVDSSISPFSLISKARISISFPYTSTGIIADHLDCPSCYYDCTGSLLKDDSGNHGVELISTKNDLFFWLKSFKEND
jgi:hypothetical protein